ncbi:Asp-tRNA(Asn)/Glu-tRNA(Gln) amidotransferase subunit GatA [Proteinivorax hydrogeniformans]|uniref:Glutamyl-tRNA(Gln) amidotransferase subunit A n=1 Tax=Proteinivorax hydrogeniformans TaxID=1826727 RepID=A0AAU8HRE8_9FIRM
MKLTNLSIKELLKGYKNNTFSPSEVTKAYLKKAKENNQKIGAYINITEDKAVEDSKSKFHSFGGVPMAIKDNIHVANVNTTCASKLLKNHKAIFNATVIKRLINCPVLGKTNMDEFAMGSSNETSAFYPVKNPWDLKKVSGGSSGGSAAAVAANLASFALGSDTGGSIRQPAAFCGVVGLRPTYGLVSRYGLVAVAPSMDQIGPLTKTVEDSAYVLSNLAGFDEKDAMTASPKTLDYTKSLKEDIKNVKIGLPKQYFTDYTNNEVRQAVNKAIRTLEKLGAKMVELDLSHTPYSVSAYTLLCAAEASSSLARLNGTSCKNTKIKGDYSKQCVNSRTEGFGIEVKRRILLGTHILNSTNYAEYYIRAQKVRTLVQRDFQRAFHSCDIILGPTTPTTAFPLNSKHDPLTMYLHDSYTTPASLAGLPAMSIPCGYDSNGLPIGLQLIAPHFKEQDILNVGHAFQLDTDYHKRKITNDEE